MSKKSQKSDNSFFSTIGTGLNHPLNLVRVLIQIGHEPLPPFKSRSLFGREQLYYPNNFAYMRYIYSVEGISGLYRGVGMKIISHSIGSLVANKVYQLVDEAEDEKDADSKRNEKSFDSLMNQTTKEITSRCWGVIISHPFHVMSLRCIAQFVGDENIYSSWNVFHNIAVIYRGEGIKGFFGGLIPRILFEASTIAITNVIAYLVKTYLIEDKDIDALIDLLASFFANSITYPLNVVSTVCAVGSCGLMAGQSPRMVTYVSWIEAFKHLYETNQLKRGSSSFFRLYTPQYPGSDKIEINGFSINTGSD